jgi:hypothetical protein
VDLEKVLRAKLPPLAYAGARMAYRWRRSAVRARRQHRLDLAASRAVAEAAVWRVQRGPFKGLRYVEAYGDLGAKILGSYEQELYPTIEQLIAVGYDNIVNVGAAEGYYAVGLAWRVPAANVIAYEISEKGRVLCAELALLNGVTVEVRGEFTLAELKLIPAGRTLVIMDIEGGELALLDPDLEPRLLDADHLVELHDFIDPTIKPTLLRRFGATHDCRIQRTADRCANDYAELTVSTRRVLNEHRPGPMEWAMMSRHSYDRSGRNQRGPAGT